MAEKEASIAQAAASMLQQTAMYKIAPVPGKGNGIVATRNIPANTEVFREMPLFTGVMGEENPIWELTARAVLSFSDPIRLSDGTPLTEDVLFTRFFGSGSYRNLWNEFDDSSLEEVKKLGGNHDIKHIYDIMATNNLNCGQLKKDGHTGMKGFFERSSMLNHSCFPNCKPVILNMETGLLALHTLRDVAAGEELTFSYSRMEIQGGSAADKKAIFDEYMQATFGFTCDCNPYEK